MTSLLFGVSPLDPVALAVAILLIAAIGLFAGFFPANDAVRVDPALTLRDMG
jgi:ABC-type lipoprotein release transport system permease subunit